MVGISLWPWYALALDAPWQMSQAEKQRLEQGKVVLRAKSLSHEYTKDIHAFLQIHAPASQVFKVITDYKNLPSFMPNLNHVEVLQHNQQGALVNYFLDLPFGVHKRYRLKLSYDIEPPDWRMAWESVPWPDLDEAETIRSTKGFWLLKPVADNTVLLHYHTQTDPGHVPFGLGWIVELLTKETVVELLENTKKRAEKQWQNHLSE